MVSSCWQEDVFCQIWGRSFPLFLKKILVLLLQFSEVSLSPQASFFQFFRGSKSSDFSAKHDMASLGIKTFRQECCRLIPFTTTEHADQFIMLNPFN